jgi:catechol 2,3-dioxygenase-like lactoylglutathione lyase family enzyme
MIIISGIQQLGIGIPDVYKAWEWYRKVFSMDIPILDEAGTAALMLPYTGGKPQERHAVLAINIQGGGGFEIWQYKSREPQPASFTLQTGDLGIFAGKMKCRDVKATFNELKSKKVELLGEISKNLSGEDHFFMKDPYGNIFEVEKSTDWFSQNKSLTGGPSGAIIGVSNIEKSVKFYAEILGYDEIVADKEGKFEDLSVLPGGNGTFRRVVLKHGQPRKGAFSRLLGNSTMELIKVQDREPKKIFENRFWGDLGFIHLCFDVRGMEELGDFCKGKGHQFTVDSSANFDMGEAAGHFTYIEDPDGTLIEFVETKRIPILKKFGWYLNLTKRNPEKPLPNWMLKTLALNRVKG